MGPGEMRQVLGGGACRPSSDAQILCRRGTEVRAVLCELRSGEHREDRFLQGRSLWCGYKEMSLSYSGGRGESLSEGGCRGPCRLA